jgi:hypothetical protein
MTGGVFFSQLFLGVLDVECRKKDCLNRAAVRSLLMRQVRDTNVGPLLCTKCSALSYWKRHLARYQPLTLMKKNRNMSV